MHYLDTSILAAYYIPEARSGAVNAFLQAQGVAAVSSLTEVEFHSAVARRVRMGELSAEDGRRILQQFALHLGEDRYQRFVLRWNEFELARDWLAALTSNLRTLDALHLAVAHGRKLPIVTADAKLADAARLHGVPVEEIA